MNTSARRCAYFNFAVDCHSSERVRSVRFAFALLSLRIVYVGLLAENEILCVKHAGV